MGLGDLILRTGVVGAALVAGCFVVMVKKPTSMFRSACQHFGAGILLGAVACELLPDISESVFVKADDQVTGAMMFLIGFTLNYCFLIFMARYVGPKVTGVPFGSEHSKDDTGVQNKYSLMDEAPRDPTIPFSLCLVVGQNCLMDGLLIGIATGADDEDIGDGSNAGWLLSISLALDGMFMGVNTTNSMLKRGVPLWKILTFCGFVASLTVVGGLIAYELIVHLDAYFDIAAFAFGVAGLTYIVTEEYMVEGHEDPEVDKWFVTILFFVAFGGVSTYHLATHSPH